MMGKYFLEYNLYVVRIHIAKKKNEEWAYLHHYILLHCYIQYLHGRFLQEVTCTWDKLTKKKNWETNCINVSIKNFVNRFYFEHFFIFDFSLFSEKCIPVSFSFAPLHYIIHTVVVDRIPYLVPKN